jgi:8-oxo-dGTP diphosphatase
MVCPACGRVAYGRLNVGAGVLVEQDGQLLLAQRGPEGAFPGTWNLPAGYCEIDEAPGITAAREAAEETGLKVEVTGLAGVYYFDDDPRGNGLLVVYDAEVVGGDLSSDGQETMAVEFFGPESLPQPLCGGGHDQAIEAWRRRSLDRWQPGQPLRFCPHCAHPLEEHMAYGRRRPLCPVCGFVYFRDLKVGVSIVVEQGGRLLLIQRGVEPGLGKWALPSGFIELEESPEEAAVRECKEETGLSIAKLELMDAVHYADDFRGPGINLVYHAQVDGGVLRSGDDARVARFFGPEELPQRSAIAFDGHRQILEQWMATRTNDGGCGA